MTGPEPGMFFITFALTVCPVLLFLFFVCKFMWIEVIPTILFGSLSIYYLFKSGFTEPGDILRFFKIFITTLIEIFMSD
jgi:hypothetical protein